MKRMVSIVLCIVMVMPLIGCGTSESKKIVACQYQYEGEGFGSPFIISLDDDGSFEYYEGGLSSYIGGGNWNCDGNELVLNDKNMSSGEKKFYFTVDGNDLMFVKEKSDDFLFVNVADGEKFIQR